jgi:hypothetical protein
MDSAMIGEDRRQRVGVPYRPRGGPRSGGAGATAMPREAPGRRVTVRRGVGSPGVDRPGAGRQGTGRPGTGRPATGRPATRRQAPAPGPARIPARTARVAPAPFVLLVLALLGGGLICLLVINTTLGAASFEIQRLQQLANSRTVQEQQLQEQLSTDQNIATIQKEACALGMRPQQQLEFLDLRTHHVYESPSGAATPGWCPR